MEVIGLTGMPEAGEIMTRAKNPKEARRIAEEGKHPWIIVDGPPGIGCPVISSLSGADFVVLVTEPTVSGLHDLKRVYELVNRFQISAGCIINKADINQDVVNHIEIYLRENNIVHLTDLPYDESFTSAMTIGQTIVEYDHDKLADLLTVSWNKIKQILSKEQQ